MLLDQAFEPGFTMFGNPSKFIWTDSTLQLISFSISRYKHDIRF